MDSTIKDLLTSNSTEVQLTLLIHMSLKIRPAKLKVAHTKYQALRLPRDVLESSMLSLQGQLESQSMPITGAGTDQESSTTARPVSITTCFWLEPLTNTTKSRTPGEKAGEKVDSSDSHQETLAESATKEDCRSYFDSLCGHLNRHS